MFGVLKGASCAMHTEERREWMGHICGVCLALRDTAGHPARIATNYDAALISVLCEAQNPAPPARVTTHCPLRSQFKAQITAPESDGSRYAAAVALMMAATKIEDHVADGETMLRYVPGPAKHLAGHWSEQGRHAASNLGFDTGRLVTQTARQSEVEAQTGCDFLHYAQPTELAVAAAFEHTAAIAGKAHNAPVLHDMGRMFGRIMFLLDSYADYAEDLAAQKFNALAACFAEAELQPQAERIFNQAYRQLRRGFHQLDLAQPTLARKLLLTQLKQRSHKVLELADCGGTCSCRLPEPELGPTGGAAQAKAQPGLLEPVITWFSRRRRRRDRAGGGLCATLICCDLCTECCCCCDCDICDCEDGGCEICECECCECCECSVCQCCGGDSGCCDCDCG